MGERRAIVGLLAIVLATASAWAAEPAEKAKQHYLQGLAYERLGRLPQAYTELQLASTLVPADVQTSVALGIVATRLGRYEVAQRALEASIAADANSVASYFHLALLYELKDQPDRAGDAWHRFAALTQDPVLKSMAQKHIQRLENP